MNSLINKFLDLSASYYITVRELNIPNPETFNSLISVLDELISEYRDQDSLPKKLVGVLADMPVALYAACLLYTSPSPRDRTRSRMPSSA